MPTLPPTRSFLLLALVGVLVALVAASLVRSGVGASDSGPLLLGALVAGAALAMFSLVPPALRLLLAGWRRVGIGPRDPALSARLADGLALAVWVLWLAGGAVALPAAWGPLLANLGMR
ncbi:hypothetical protein FOY91_20100 [Sphingomonas solaris]|uniref:Uncharacterized protein n=2 Tax=Alterirhizorhabdus solaris TaxID=2529389 RepID=A0A558QSC7_9SPHN|nr:hypothetical protein FOY91_20100 [Sphingomonas solaris]